MHYYSHNIGDYRKDTSHLSLLEHGIYRQLLDSYYLDETPLSNDLAKLMRSHSVRNAYEQQALQNVLTDFFELTEKGYIHKRCDQLIAAYHGKSEKARESANARWNKKNNGLGKKSCEGNANALQSDCEGNANHKPITINQEPIKTLEGFSEFWMIYERKGSKMQAEKEWKKLKPSIELQLQIYDAARIYVRATPDKKFRKDGSTWLHNQCWNDEVTVSTQPKKMGFFAQLGMIGDQNDNAQTIAIGLDK